MLIIGLVLNSLSNNNIKTFRIPGVLQRLSFVYLIVALTELTGFDPEDNQRVFQNILYRLCVRVFTQICISSTHGSHLSVILFALGGSGS